MYFSQLSVHNSSVFDIVVFIFEWIMADVFFLMLYQTPFLFLIFLSLFTRKEHESFITALLHEKLTYNITCF